MKSIKALLIAVVVLCMPALSSASVFTMTSPTSFGALPGTVSAVGGIVLDLVGANNNRVVAQLAASALYVGFANTDPQAIGTQTGFSPAVVAALGGGLTSAAVRITLWDGDTAAGNFDDNDNTLLLNGYAMGNFSNVQAQETDSNGVASGAPLQYGFDNERLFTGFFYNNSAAFLSSLYTSLGGGGISYALTDVDPYDNYYDFTQGIDASLINVGTGPIVNPTLTPEPGTFALLGLGLLGVFAYSRRQQRVGA